MDYNFASVIKEIVRMKPELLILLCTFLSIVTYNQIGIKDNTESEQHNETVVEAQDVFDLYNRVEMPDISVNPIDGFALSPACEDMAIYIDAKSYIEEENDAFHQEEYRLPAVSRTDRRLYILLRKEYKPS